MTLRLAAAGYTYAGADGPALVDVDLEIRPGEVVGVTGPGEAGKSTLGLVAAGIAPAVAGGRLSGIVTVDDLDTATAKPHELAQRCGILFQHPASQLSHTAPTVWEEVALGPRNLSLPLSEVVERTWSALAAVGTEHLAEREPTRLSGGQLQLVALAAVLAMRPRHMVLDEPTAQLDPAGTRLVGRAIEALAAAGSAVLLVEQRPDLLAGVADRLLVLVDGRIAVAGPTGEVFGDDRLDEWQVERPAPERLRRALRAAGLRVELPA